MGVANTLVLGAAGSLGRVVLAELTSRGRSVVALQAPGEPALRHALPGARLVVADPAIGASLYQAAACCDSIVAVLSPGQGCAGQGSAQVLRELDALFYAARERKLARVVVVTSGMAFETTEARSSRRGIDGARVGESAPAEARLARAVIERVSSERAALLVTGEVLDGEGGLDAQWVRSFLLKQGQVTIPAGGATWVEPLAVARAVATVLSRPEVRASFVLGGTIASYRELAQVLGELTTLPIAPRDASRFSAQLCRLWTRRAPSSCAEQDPWLARAASAHYAGRWVALDDDEAREHLGFASEGLRPAVLATLRGLVVGGTLPGAVARRLRLELADLS